MSAGETHTTSLAGLGISRVLCSALVTPTLGRWDRYLAWRGGSLSRSTYVSTNQSCANRLKQAFRSGSLYDVQANHHDKEATTKPEKEEVWLIHAIESDTAPS